MLQNHVYKTRFIRRNEENVDQALLRYALQYYSCYTVEGLKIK